MSFRYRWNVIIMCFKIAVYKNYGCNFALSGRLILEICIAVFCCKVLYKFSKPHIDTFDRKIDSKHFILFFEI